MRFKLISDLLEVFKSEYEKVGEGLITDEHSPDDGDYILVERDGEEFEIFSSAYIKMDKKTREIDESIENLSLIRKLDYMSRYLNSNKALTNKNIHSNNYLSFFVRKESLVVGEDGSRKVDEKVISDYFDFLRDPLSRYGKSKEDRGLYMAYQEEYGEPDIEAIDRIEGWIKRNLFDLLDQESNLKERIKLFFLDKNMTLEENLELYRIESERYFSVKIYNSNKRNLEVDGVIYGLPNYNMGLNDKKPYLENKTRKTREPILIDRETAILQKKFFDYLENKCVLRKNNIYVDTENKVFLFDEKSMNNFSGYYLRVSKGKEIVVEDYDEITKYGQNLSKALRLENVLDFEHSKMEYRAISKLSEVEALLSKVLYSDYLKNNYFTESKNIRTFEADLKRELLITRGALFRWFYKGNSSGVWRLIDKSSKNLILGSIREGNIFRAKDQFNLRFSMKNYFEGGENLSDIIYDLKETLREKVNRKETGIIESDGEYYFAVGQATGYLITLSKGKDKNHSLANSILNAKSDKRIKDELKKLYRKYNYDISYYSNRFNNLFGMIVSYVPEASAINDDMIIAGYLHSNLIYEKNSEVEGGSISE